MTRIEAEVWQFYRSGLREECVADNPMEALAAYDLVDAAIAHMVGEDKLGLEMRAGSLFIVRKVG
jgi:hypothetical protein